MTDRLLNNHAWLEFEQTYRRRGTLDLSGPLTFSDVIVLANELGHEPFVQGKHPESDLPLGEYCKDPTIPWRDREVFAQAVLDHLQDIGLVFMTVAHVESVTGGLPMERGYIDLDPRT